MKPKRGRQWGESVEIPPLPLDYPIGLDRAISTTERTFLVLRRAILTGLLAPNSWLRLDDISEQLDVSRTPVREACRLLSQDGLVKMVPNYGVMVSPLSIDDFEEIYAVRIGIEGLAIRRTVRRTSLEEMEQCRELYMALEPCAQSGELEEYLHQEWLFRLHLYQIGSSQRFLHMIQNFREQSERYLRYAYTFQEAISDSYAMHKDILMACEKRDVDYAEHLVQQALRWTLKMAGPAIASSLEEQGNASIKEGGE